MLPPVPQGGRSIVCCSPYSRGLQPFEFEGQFHLSYNPAGRSHCRLQNHRGRGGSPGDVGEVPHSSTLTSLHLRHSSFSNSAAAFPTSQLILQHFRCFTYVKDTSPTSQLIFKPSRRITYITAHSTTLPLLHLRHRHFTDVAAHSPTLPPLNLRHSSFYNSSAASPTSQVILQPFCCFTYVTGASRTSPGEPHMHKDEKSLCGLACY